MECHGGLRERSRQHGVGVARQRARQLALRARQPVTTSVDFWKASGCSGWHAFVDAATG